MKIKPQSVIPLIGVITICCIPCISWAQAPSEQLEIEALFKKGFAELMEIEVSLATGTLKPLKLAPSVSTVITAEDIEDMGATTLDEILETVPGLHVQPAFGNIFVNRH